MSAPGKPSAPCGVNWPACPSCPGSSVEERFRPGASEVERLRDGLARCRSCGRSWPLGERVPCPDPGVVGLADAEGGTARLVCTSHAAHPSADGLRVALRAVPVPPGPPGGARGPSGGGRGRP